MTAAIPPACCADADDESIHTQLFRIRRIHRFGLACAGADAAESGIRGIGIGQKQFGAFKEQRKEQRL
jgi:hypothetical protein